MPRNPFTPHLKRHADCPSAVVVVARTDDTGQTLAFVSTTGSLWVLENGGKRRAHLPHVGAVRFGR